MSLPVLNFPQVDFSTLPNPAAGRSVMGVDTADNHLKRKFSDGTVFDYDLTIGVTNFIFTNANGISGVVTNPNTTPTLVLSLGNITPTLVTCAGAIIADTNLKLSKIVNDNLFLSADGPTGITTGDYNIGIGSKALKQLTTASQNIAIGYETLLGVITSAARNIAIGFNTLRSNTTGSRNTGVGHSAGYANQTGDSNTAIGDSALFNNTGSRNTALGEYAGVLQTNKNGNVYLGYRAGYNNNTDNKLFIANTDTGAGSKLLTGKFDTDQIGINIDPASIDPAAILQLESTTKGFLPPRMTTAQRLAIASPPNGLLVLDTDIKEYYVYIDEWIMLPRNRARFNSDIIDDWIAATVASLMGWVTTVNGAGSAAALTTTGVDSTLKAQGVVSLNTGTTNTGRTALSTVTNMLLGFTKIKLRWRVYIPVLSDGTNTYAAFFGLGDTPAGAGIAQTHGVAFIYDSTISVNWICRTTAGGISTSQTTTVPVNSASFVRLEISINENGTSIEFRINDLLVHTATTNIPGATQFIGPLIKISKSVGGTARLVYVDYYQQNLTWSSGR